MRLLKEEFGTFGLELGGGSQQIGQRLSENRCNQFEEYERMRSRSFPDSPREIHRAVQPTKEHPDEQATL
jgi:hypothetical protein